MSSRSRRLFLAYANRLVHGVQYLHFSAAARRARALMARPWALLTRRWLRQLLFPNLTCSTTLTLVLRQRKGGVVRRYAFITKLALGLCLYGTTLSADAYELTCPSGAPEPFVEGSFQIPTNPELPLIDPSLHRYWVAQFWMALDVCQSEVDEDIFYGAGTTGCYIVEPGEVDSKAYQADVYRSDCRQPVYTVPVLRRVTYDPWNYYRPGKILQIVDRYWAGAEICGPDTVRDAATGGCVPPPPPPPEDPSDPPPDPNAPETPDKNAGPPPPGDCVGNPCSASTGNKYQAEVDYQGANGVPGLTRAYNSSRINADLGFGPGWSTSLRPRLGIDPADSSSVGRYERTGRGEPFACSAVGPCFGDSDSEIVLSKDAAGYTLGYDDGRSDRYDLDGRLIAETDRAGNTTNYNYNANGDLDTLTGPYGHSLHLTYNTDGRIETVTDSAGNAFSYGYDAAGNLVRVTYPDNTGKLYHYEDPALLHHLTGISTVDRTGTATRYATYAYAANGKAILTEHAQTTHPVPQERSTLAYDSATQTTVTDAAGNVEILRYAENLGLKNLLSRLHQADGKGRRQTFDANNNLSCQQDAEGRVTTYEYNASNQRTRLTEGQGGTCAAPTSGPETRTTTYEYFVAEGLPPHLDLIRFIRRPSVAAGQTQATETRYEHPTHWTLPTSIIQRGYAPDGTAVSRAISFSYNTQGQLIAIDGPRTDVTDITTLAYYECTTGAECGQLQAVTNALGQETTYDFYYADGRLKQLTDPNGLITTYTYDARGRADTVTQTPPGGTARVTRYAYTAFGAIETDTTPDGITLTYAYDAAQDLRRITDNLGNTIEYDYDVRGNRSATRIKDPDNTLVRAGAMGYDLRNRLETINAAGSLTTQIHDAVGNLVSVTDPNHNADGTLTSTTHTRDPLNRLRQTLDVVGWLTAYDYDVNDRLTQVQTPNSATTGYIYDDLGNLIKETSPDRGTLSYTHDAAGNIITSTDARGVQAIYTYDALNRRTQVNLPGSTLAIRYTYDTCANGNGRLCTVSDASGTTRYGYDAFGNIVEQNRTIQGITYRTQYTYDAANRVTRITYPDGRVIDYGRDAVGRIGSVNLTVDGVTTTLSGNRAYRADRLLTVQTFGNGLTETRGYDLQGRLQTYTLGTVENRDYALYDVNGNLKTLTASAFSGGYSYDELNRLASETREAVVYGFEYDGNGNREAFTQNAETIAIFNHTPGTNRLASVVRTDPGGGPPATDTLSVDAAGNLIDVNNGETTLSYHPSGHLATVTRDGVQVAAYTYDARRLRTRKVTPWGTARYHYDLAGNLILETTATGIPFRAYVWADGVPVAQIDIQGTSETITYLHTDHLATPRVGTDANGAVVWRWEGEAFGATLADEDPDGDGVTTTVNLRFPGQYYDAETGLHYNWHRYYDPSLGRYITADPIGLLRDYSDPQLQIAIEKGVLEETGLAGEELNHLYGYAGQNPLYWFDPYGLAKGGKQNISTEGFTPRSDPKELEKHLKEVMKTDPKNTKRINKLRALLKVIKRGGRLGPASLIPFDDEFFCVMTGMFCEPRPDLCI